MESLQLIISKIAPIDVASIIASIASIIVAVIGAKSINKKSTESKLNNSGYETTAQVSGGDNYALIVCFFIYAFCGFLSALLLWMATLIGKSTWGSVNLVWVVGNFIILFILYKKYISELLK